MIDVWGYVRLAAKLIRDPNAGMRFILFYLVFQFTMHFSFNFLLTAQNLQSKKEILLLVYEIFSEIEIYDLFSS